MASGLPFSAAGHYIVGAVAGKAPAVVHCPDHPGAGLTEILKEHGKIAVVAVYIMKVNYVGLKAPEFPDEPPGDPLGDKSVPPADARSEGLDTYLPFICIADTLGEVALPDAIQDVVLIPRIGEHTADLLTDHTGAAPSAGRIDLNDFDLDHLPEETIRKNIQSI